MNELNQKYSMELTDIWQSSCQYPAAAMTEDGSLYVCWQEYKNRHDTAWAAKMEDGKPGHPVRLSLSGEALKPVCAAQGNKVWYAWSECDPAEHGIGTWHIYYRWYENGEYGPVKCAESGEALFYPFLYINKDDVYLLWNRQGTHKGEILMAVLGAEEETKTEIISLSEECYRPYLCITEDGVKYVVYDSFNGTNYDILARACVDGVWTPEQKVSTSETAWASCPAAAAAKDRAVVCWYDFDHGAAFSYHSAELRVVDGILQTENRVCFAEGIDWYQDVDIASNRKGQIVYTYSWGKTKLHVRKYKGNGQWEDPVVMTYDDQNFASNQKILLDEEGTIRLVWQFANKNGHKPHRHAQVVYTWLPGAEYEHYTDTEAELVSDTFCRPIEAPKTLTRIGEAETKAWLKKNGYQEMYPVFGDIHGQSGMTDGVGELDQYFNIAKVWANLDFTALTDHDCYPDWLSQSEWEWIRTATHMFNVKNEMAALLAYEWTPNEYRYDYGHKNIYYRDCDGDIFRSGDEGGMTPDRLFESLKKYTQNGSRNADLSAAGGHAPAKYKAMAFPHHPAASWKLVSAATDWAFHDEEIQRMVEIFSRHAPFEYYGNYSKYTKNNMQIEHCSVQDALERGYHMGFTAGSDSHQMEHGVEGGIAVSFVKELSNETVWDNLYDRFTYATTGAGILVSFRANGSEMGQILQVKDKAEFAVSVLGTDKVKVEVLCNNEVILTEEPDSRACDFAFTRAAGEKEDTYYLRVTQEDEHQAWSSPIWIRK